MPQKFESGNGKWCRGAPLPQSFPSSSPPRNPIHPQGSFGTAKALHPTVAFPITTSYEMADGYDRIRFRNGEAERNHDDDVMRGHTAIPFCHFGDPGISRYGMVSVFYCKYLQYSVRTVLYPAMSESAGRVSSPSVRRSSTIPPSLPSHPSSLPSHP